MFGRKSKDLKNWDLLWYQKYLNNILVNVNTFYVIFIRLKMSFQMV